jgi:hypothetical protein
VTADPLSREALELLIRGHNLYGSDHSGTRRVLDDARSDSMPAADTPLGRQERALPPAGHLANICASMNYVIHRYGVSLTGKSLAAAVQQADAHRPPKGY